MHRTKRPRTPDTEPEPQNRNARLPSEPPRVQESDRQESDPFTEPPSRAPALVPARRSSRLGSETSVLVPQPKERAPYGSGVAARKQQSAGQRPVGRPPKETPRRPVGRPRIHPVVVEDPDQPRRPVGRPRKTAEPDEPREQAEVLIRSFSYSELDQIRDARRAKVPELRQRIQELLAASSDIFVLKLDARTIICRATHTCLEATGMTPCQLAQPAVSLGRPIQALSAEMIRGLWRIVLHPVWNRIPQMIPWIIAIAYAMRVGLRTPVRLPDLNMRDTRFLDLQVRLREESGLTVDRVIAAFEAEVGFRDSEALVALSGLYEQVVDIKSPKLDPADLQAVSNTLDAISHTRFGISFVPNCEKLWEFDTITLPDTLCVSEDEIERVHAADLIRFGQELDDEAMSLMGELPTRTRLTISNPSIVSMQRAFLRQYLPEVATDLGNAKLEQLEEAASHLALVASFNRGAKRLTPSQYMALVNRCVWLIFFRDLLDWKPPPPFPFHKLWPSHDFAAEGTAAVYDEYRAAQLKESPSPQRLM
ncbi:hypothetical protein B0I35DRAFT_481197 [Stachybotrys elegans]|uniref:Uncharacterized protein n=1 Tax=Stachybotrys elegans TaxID=80388 RepID=A0A8K0SKP3_9HYPO|nr:hypothetical protein B0I35DRAFT_481197 [Stachybotrys elegans]